MELSSNVQRPNKISVRTKDTVENLHSKLSKIEITYRT